MKFNFSLKIILLLTLCSSIATHTMEAPLKVQQKQIAKDKKYKLELSKKAFLLRALWAGTKFTAGLLQILEQIRLQSSYGNVFGGTFTKKSSFLKNGQPIGASVNRHSFHENLFIHYGLGYISGLYLLQSGIRDFVQLRSESQTIKARTTENGSVA